MVSQNRPLVEEPSLKFCDSAIDPTVLVREPESPREARSTLANPPVWLQEFFGGGTKAAGVTVSESTALSASAVFACVRNLAEDLAKLPLITYRRLDPTGKERMPEHPLYRVLHDDPNPEMTAFDFRQAVTASAVLWGGGYAEIEMTGRGDVAYLWPIEPWRVRVDRDSAKRLVYIVDGKTTMTADELLHLKGFSITGIVGLMIAATGKDSLGLTLAAQKFAASFFANGMNVAGVLSHPGRLGPQGADNLRKSWTDVHGGPDKAHKPAILEEGMTYAKIGTEPNDAQMVETRQFQVEDVARWFRMPPHKIQHLLRSTFSNIEHQSIEYVTDTLQPWAVKWEQEIGKKLLADEPEIFVEHLFEALLRGDTLARAQAFEVQFRNGIVNNDEWRAAENRNPLPNGQGKNFFVPMNMTTIDRAINPPEPNPETPPEPKNPPGANGEPNRSAFEPVMADVARRVSRRELEVLQKGKDAAKFFSEHRAYVAASIKPLLRSIANAEGAKANIDAAADGIAERYCNRSAESTSDVVLDDWQTEQAIRLVDEIKSVKWSTDGN